MHPRSVSIMLAFAVAFGALVVGHGLVVPLAQSPSALADANLARALCAPLAERIGSVALVACALSWAVSLRGWPRGALDTLAGCALVLCAVDRFWLLPQLHEAGAAVDLVTQSPAASMASYGRAQLLHQLAVASAVVFLSAHALGIARLTERARVRALGEAAAEAASEGKASPHPSTESPAGSGLGALSPSA